VTVSKLKLAKQTMPSNPGATFQSYASEEVEEDGEVVAEEKEGHEDAAQDKAMIKKMMKKETMKEKMKEDMDALSVAKIFQKNLFLKQLQFLNQQLLLVQNQSWKISKKNCLNSLKKLLKKLKKIWY
jgi:hypothetical protein